MNSEQMQTIVFPEGNRKSSSSNSPEPCSSISTQSVYYYDPASVAVPPAVYIPYVPELPISSPSRLNSSADWYMSGPPPANQHWYSASGDASGSFYSALGYPYYPSVYTSDAHVEPVDSASCVGPWDAWPLASAAASTSFCPIQSDSPYLYTWTESRQASNAPSQDQRHTGCSMQDGISGFEKVFGPWQEKTGTVKEGLANTNVIANSLISEDHTDNPPGVSTGDLSFSHGNSTASNLAFNGSCAVTGSLLDNYSSVAFGDMSQSGNPMVLYPQFLMDMPPTNIQEQGLIDEASKAMNSQIIDLSDLGNKCSTSEDSFSKCQESLFVTESSTQKNTLEKKTNSTASASQDFSPILLSNKPVCIAPTVTNKDKVPTDTLQILNNNDEQSIKNNDCTPCAMKEHDLGFSNSVQCLSAHDKHSQVVDILSSNHYPPSPKCPLSLSFKENSPGLSHSTCSEGSKVDCFSDPQQPPSMSNENKCYECSHGCGKSVTSVNTDSSVSKEIMPKHDMAMNSRKNEKLIQAMHNLSLMLIATQISQSSDNLTDCDLERLQSTICNLSEYILKMSPNSRSSISNLFNTKEFPPNSFATQKCCKGDGVEFIKVEPTVSLPCSVAGVAKVFSENTPSENHGEVMFSIQDSLQEPLAKLYKSDKAKSHEITHNEGKSFLESLKQNMRSEVAERCNKIHLYRALLGNAEAEIDLLKLENRFIQAELEMEKQKNSGSNNVSYSENFRNMCCQKPGNSKEVDLEKRGNGFDHAHTVVPRTALAVANHNKDSASEFRVDDSEDIASLFKEEVMDQGNSSLINQDVIGLSVTKEGSGIYEDSLIDSHTKQSDGGDPLIHDSLIDTHMKQSDGCDPLIHDVSRMKLGNVQNPDKLKTTSSCLSLKKPSESSNQNSIHKLEGGSPPRIYERSFKEVMKERQTRENISMSMKTSKQTSSSNSQGNVYHHPGDSLISSHKRLQSYPLLAASSDAYGGDTSSNLMKPPPLRSGSFSFGDSKLESKQRNAGSEFLNLSYMDIVNINRTMPQQYDFKHYSKYWGSGQSPSGHIVSGTSLWHDDAKIHSSLTKDLDTEDDPPYGKDLGDTFSEKVSEIEKTDPVESNSLTDALDQSIISLLDEGSNAESLEEYRFVSCQSNIENLSILKSEGESLCSDSESGWEEVDREYHLFP